jgi:hypothetical protein
VGNEDLVVLINYEQTLKCQPTRTSGQQIQVAATVFALFSVVGLAPTASCCTRFHGP